MRTRRVLIVDDMEANRYVLRKILACEANFQILEAATGAEGLALMIAGVDLVILDINLPDMTGFELIQKAEQSLGPSRLPAIINISATFISGKDKATGLNTGARAYLTHPINPDEVLATITSLLKSNTRMERIERQRNWAEARNEQLSKEKVMLERFMRSFSHDLRSPLSAAVMATGLMQRNPARRTEDLLAVLQDNLRRIDEMVGNLLDISHVSVGGGIKLLSESMELGMLLRDAVANLALQLENPLELQLESPELQITWDRSAFLRIFDNLVGNAAKHGQALKPIRIEQSQEGDLVRLVVTNQGNFPEEVLENLATPYFISSRSDTKGWGLGLPIVKALAESFGGEVNFSNQGDLARVELLLPVALAGLNSRDGDMKKARQCLAFLFLRRPVATLGPATSSGRHLSPARSGERRIDGDWRAPATSSTAPLLLGTAATVLTGELAHRCRRTSAGPACRRMEPAKRYEKASNAARVKPEASITPRSRAFSSGRRSTLRTPSTDMPAASNARSSDIRLPTDAGSRPASWSSRNASMAKRSPVASLATESTLLPCPSSPAPITR